MKREKKVSLLFFVFAGLLALGGALGHPAEAASSGSVPVFGVVPLVAYNVSVSAISETGATITWNTNGQADSTVEYGLTSGYGQVRTEPTMVVNHTIQLAGLTPGTAYHFRVVSANLAGYVYRGADLQFRTGGFAPGPGGGGGSGGGSWGPSRLILPDDCRASSGGVITPVTGVGILSSCTIISSANGMTDLRSSWSVNILEHPPDGARFVTYIMPQPSDSTGSAFDVALGSSGFRMIAVAYVMEVVQSPHVANGNAVIQMDVNRSWVSGNGGVDAVRILRQGEDGLVQVLETRFSNYVLDSGHMNFRAVSPDDLALYALVTMESVPVPAGTTTTPADTTAMPTETATGATGVPTPGPTGFLPMVILALAAIAVIAAGLILSTRKKRE